MRTWESWARVSARPPPAQWGQEPWVWQPFLLAGTTLGTGATSASKSARGLGPADQTQGSLAQRDRGRPSSWGRLEPGRVACKPFPGLERAWGLPGAPRTSPSRALRGRHSRGLSALPNAWRVLSPASAKELPSPMESARVENQASLVSPEPRGRLPQWTGPTGGALQRGAGQVALPTSCVNRMSRQTPSAGFKADDHQSRQSQGRRFGARLLTPNNTREQSQLLWKVPWLPQQAGGLQGTRAARPRAAGNPPGPTSGWRARPQANCFQEEVHPMMQFQLVSKF